MVPNGVAQSECPISGGPQITWCLTRHGDAAFRVGQPRACRHQVADGRRGVIGGALGHFPPSPSSVQEAVAKWWS
jgi:hypothetical protein